MLLSPRKNGLTSLNKEVRVFKVLLRHAIAQSADFKPALGDMVPMVSRPTACMGDIGRLQVSAPCSLCCLGFPCSFLLQGFPFFFAFSLHFHDFCGLGRITNLFIFLSCFLRFPQKK